MKPEPNVTGSSPVPASLADEQRDQVSQLGSRLGIGLFLLLAAHVVLTIVSPTAVNIALGVLGLGIAVAMGIHVAFLRVGLADTKVGVILVHLIPVMPYMVLTLTSVFANYNLDYEGQARTLGARPWQVFIHVTLPAIWPGLMVGCLFAFIISWSQYLLTLLIGGGEVITLPVLLFAFANSGDNAITAALSLVFIAPALLLLPNPLPFLLWGLPGPLRLGVGGVLNRVIHKRSPIGRVLRLITTPVAVWFLFVGTIIGWHDPALYNAALRSDWVHDLEHVTMFVAGMLYWWLVSGAGPRLHKNLSRVAKIAFILAVIPPNMALGIVLAFSQQPIYAFYSDMPRLWGISALDDQRISGVIMWIPGNMMHFMTALALIFMILSGEGRKSATKEATWAEGDALAPPGTARPQHRPRPRNRQSFQQAAWTGPSLLRGQAD